MAQEFEPSLVEIETAERLARLVDGLAVVETSTLDYETRHGWYGLPRMGLVAVEQLYVSMMLQDHDPRCEDTYEYPELKFFDGENVLFSVSVFQGEPYATTENGTDLTYTQTELFERLGHIMHYLEYLQGSGMLTPNKETAAALEAQKDPLAFLGARIRGVLDERNLTELTMRSVVPIPGMRFLTIAADEQSWRAQLSTDWFVLGEADDRLTGLRRVEELRFDETAPEGLAYDVYLVVAHRASTDDEWEVREAPPDDEPLTQEQALERALQLFRLIGFRLGDMWEGNLLTDEALEGLIVPSPPHITDVDKL